MDKDYQDMACDIGAFTPPKKSSGFSTTQDKQRSLKIEAD